MSDSFLAVSFNQLPDTVDQSILCGSQTPIILPKFDLMSESDLLRVNHSADETPRTSGLFTWTDDDNNNNNNENEINSEKCRPKRKRNLMKYLEPLPKKRKLGKEKQKTVEVKSENIENNPKVKNNKKVTAKKSSLKNQPDYPPTETIRMTRSRARMLKS